MAPKLNLTALEEFKALLREQSKRGVRPESKPPSTAVELESKRWEAKTPEERALSESVLNDYLAETGAKTDAPRFRTKTIYSEKYGEDPTIKAFLDNDRARKTKANVPPGSIAKTLDEYRKSEAKEPSLFGVTIGGASPKLEFGGHGARGVSPREAKRLDYYKLKRDAVDASAAQNEIDYWRAVEDPDILPMNLGAPLGMLREESEGATLKGKKATLTDLKKLLAKEASTPQQPPSLPVELESAKWGASTADDRATAEMALKDYLAENAANTSAPRLSAIDLNKRPYSAALDERIGNAITENTNARIDKTYRGPGIQKHSANVVEPVEGPFTWTDSYTETQWKGEPLPEKPHMNPRDWRRESKRLEKSYWSAVEDPDILPMKAPVAPKSGGDESKLSDFKRALLWAARKAGGEPQTIAEAAKLNPLEEWMSNRGMDVNETVRFTLGQMGELGPAERVELAKRGKNPLEDIVDAMTSEENMVLMKLLSKVR